MGREWKEAMISLCGDAHRSTSPLNITTMAASNPRPLAPKPEGESEYTLNLSNLPPRRKPGPVKTGVHGKRVSIEIRATILTLHCFTDKRWPEIGAETGDNARTAEDIVARAKERAEEGASFMQIHACLVGPDENKNGAEKQIKIPLQSETAMELIALATSDAIHRDMTWPEVAKDLDIHVARSTLEKIFHGNRLNRYVSPLKLPLTEKMMHDRVALAELGLTIDIRRIVFTDEMWVRFNEQRRARKQTRFQDEHTWECPRPKRDKDPDSRGRVMFTSAINRLVGQAPGYIYPKTTPESKKRNVETAKLVEGERQERAQKRIALAAEPGTAENLRVAGVNAQIDQRNEEEGRTGRHKLRHRNPTQVFKESKLPDPSKTKGGINWTAYREQYLHPILYPWIREVLQPQLRALTGDDTVWLVEDNAPSHQTARGVDFEAREAMNLKTFNWRAQSPDLNEIERCWDYEKVGLSSLACYSRLGAFRRAPARSSGCFVDAADAHCLQDDISCFHFTGASQEEIARAKARLSTFLYPVLRFAVFLRVVLLFYASLIGQTTLLATWNALPAALIEGLCDDFHH
jgi:hypothetical protein